MIEAEHATLGARWLFCAGTPELLFTENETNLGQLFGVPNPTPYTKDSINDYVVHGDINAVNRSQTGTKAAAAYRRMIGAGQSVTLQLRLCNQGLATEPFGPTFHDMLCQRQREADEFYATVIPATLSR